MISCIPVYWAFPVCSQKSLQSRSSSLGNFSKELLSLKLLRFDPCLALLNLLCPGRPHARFRAPSLNSFYRVWLISVPVCSFLALSLSWLPANFSIFVCSSAQHLFWRLLHSAFGNFNRFPMSIYSYSRCFLYLYRSWGIVVLFPVWFFSQLLRPRYWVSTHWSGKL